MRILAIETSCDETAAAVIEDGRRVRSNVVASQEALHALTGGIVPEVAARAHLRALVPVVRRAIADAGGTWAGIDAVAATAGPGLPGALVVGLNGARGLAYARGLPLIPVDHIEGHVRANWLAGDGDDPIVAGPDDLRPPAGERPPLPALALVISGGHTELLLISDDGPGGSERIERLGGTRDDAAGEAFDKVARLLGLGYPGGPPVSRLAEEAVERRLRLPRAWLPRTDDFSFSGLKTAVMQVLRDDAPPPAEIAWAFQESVADVLSKKASRVAAREGVASLLVAGGVAANRRIREAIAARAPVPVFIPPPRLCTDNAAMIGAAAFHHLDEARPAERALDIRPVAYRSRVRPAPGSGRRGGSRSRVSPTG